MRGVNKVILIGNLGKEPEILFINGNVPMVRFPLATTEVHKDNNGVQQSQTEWHNIVIWRGLAELAQRYLHKGSMVYIEGKLRSRTWEDKDGVKRTATDVHADNFVMLDKRKDSGEDNQTYVPQAAAHVQTQPQTSSYNLEDNAENGGTVKDDLPF